MKHLKQTFTLFLFSTSLNFLIAQNLTVEGKVGIGTENPAKELTVIGDVQLSGGINANTNAVINAFDGGGTNSLLDFNLHPDGNNPAQIRLFRTTNVSTAPVTLRILKGNNSTAHNAQIAGNNADTYFALDYGNVGIGTSTPEKKLDVRGELIVQDESKIATFESSGVNSFVEFANNGGTTGANIGYFNNNSDQYFFINTPAGDFGEFTVLNNGFVGIGTINPIRTLHVEGNAWINGTATGLYTQANNRSNTTNAAYAVEARAFFDDNQALKSGVYARVEGDGLIHYGVQGLGLGDAVNYGVRGQASSSSNSTQYGVYGTGSGGGTEYAGYFAGNLRYTGTLTGPSDRKLKRSIKSIQSASDLLAKLHPVSYQYRSKEFLSMMLPEGNQFGFIAQEVEEVLPELVEDDIHPEYVPYDSTDRMKAFQEVSYKSINYIGLIPLLTKAIQEQQTIIVNQEDRIKNQEKTNENLRAKVETLEIRLTQIEALLQNNTVDNRLSTSNTILTDAKLEQNQPNPFTENTLIRYYIPKGITTAVLRITSIEGKVMKDVTVTSRGIGQTELQAQSLSPGNYFYSLILDDKVLETRQMILTNH